MCRPAFDALDRSWTILARSPEATAALDRLQAHPDLTADDLDDLVTRVWAASKPNADRVHAALAELAHADTTAARVLLQMLRPGLRSLGRRQAFGGSFDEVDQDVIALAWEQIRTYPIDRRPSAIAANILLDVRKRYVRVVLEGSDLLSLDEVPDGRLRQASSAEDEAIDGEGPSLQRAHALLATAVHRGTITAASATVVWRTRVQQDDDVDVTADLGVGVRTLQRRRQRAERLLAAAC